MHYTAFDLNECYILYVTELPLNLLLQLLRKHEETTSTHIYKVT